MDVGCTLKKGSTFEIDKTLTPIFECQNSSPLEPLWKTSNTFFFVFRPSCNNILCYSLTCCLFVSNYGSHRFHLNSKLHYIWIKLSESFDAAVVDSFFCIIQGFHKKVWIVNAFKCSMLPFHYLTVFVPTFDTKVTEYLCSGWVFFSSDKFRLFN